jgi:hypothetical protein
MILDSLDSTLTAFPARALELQCRDRRSIPRGSGFCLLEELTKRQSEHAVPITFILDSSGIFAPRSPAL